MIMGGSLAARKGLDDQDSSSPSSHRSFSKTLQRIAFGNPQKPRDLTALRHKIFDRAFQILTGGMAYLVLIVLLGAAFSMFWGGREALSKFGLEFVTRTVWNPVTKEFSALVPIYGTLVTSL